MTDESIERIRHQFKDEWLLIAVSEVDEANSVPLKGHLIAHSPSRVAIHKISKEYKGVAYVVYSEDWPEDLAACFINIK